MRAIVASPHCQAVLRQGHGKCVVDVHWAPEGLGPWGTCFGAIYEVTASYLPGRCCPELRV